MLCLLHECVGKITRAKQSSSEQEKCAKWTDSEADAPVTDGYTNNRQQQQTKQ